MSHLLELLGKGLEQDLCDLLERYFRPAGVVDLAQLEGLCSSSPDSADAHVQLGIRLLRTGETDRAIEHLQRASGLAPDLAVCRLALAAALAEAGRTQPALEELQAANRLQPGLAPVLFAIGLCMEKLRRPGDAAAHYRDAVARDPELSCARQRLAAVCIVQGDLAGAIEQYEALRKLIPQDALVRTGLAHLYFQAKRFSMAIDEFETAIAMQPENWSLMNDEVEALVANGQVRDAIERLHQLLQAQGPFSDLHVRLADLYGQVGDDEAALRHYHAAMELDGDYLEAAVKLGTHHLVFGRWEQAAEAFGEAIAINDAQMVNYVGLGASQAAAGKTAEAMNSFELAAAVEPNSTLLLAEMARLQLRCAASREMERSFCAPGEEEPRPIDLDKEDLLRHQLARYAGLVARCPDHADLRYHYAMLLHANAQTPQAIAQLQEALRINPSFAQARIKLGVLQMDSGLEEQAVHSFQESLELQPGSAEAHYWLGLLHTDRRQLEEAARHMEAAAEASPDNTSVRAALAMSLQNLGLLDRSASVWRSVWRACSPQRK